MENLVDEECRGSLVGHVHPILSQLRVLADLRYIGKRCPCRGRERYRSYREQYTDLAQVPLSQSSMNFGDLFTERRL